MAALYAGDFLSALAQLERGIAVYDPEVHGAGRSPVYWTGHDSGVSCAMHAAWALWVLGRPRESAQRMEQGLEWAREAAYPFTLANASHFAVLLAEYRRDVATVRAIVESGVLDSDHGFELLTILAGLHRGWLDGDPDAMRASVAAFRARGGGIGAPAFMALTAEAFANAGRAAAGLQVVDEAVALVNAGGAHYWDAELERVRGTLVLLGGGDSAVREAEACFGRAIDIARRHGAKTFELRAATNLAELGEQPRRRR
jgi:predicted ATPase